MAAGNNRCKIQLSTGEFNERITCLQLTVNKPWFLRKDILEIKRKYMVVVLSLGFAVSWVWIFTLPIAAMWPWAS